ncbi:MULTISPECIES: hypothetical protein [Actinomadura]|uniref:Uncharacterized protein n=1 Tax=Actinomadura yumaensis TaxID=111807 RepID=A0ABW2CFT4_9ACTN|nr:hypothetical protein [Actinomadura sp. J1-007]
MEQVGAGSEAKGLGETLGADFARAEFISLPLTLLIMLVVFGAVIAAGVPEVLALSSGARRSGCRDWCRTCCPPPARSAT